ncbi:hypothetical protein KBA73_02350 [Patescibacteria group bacterium]|nr:hypothetical protein [Patescibacteria group bacterium]
MNPTTEETQESAKSAEQDNPLAILDDLEPEQLVFVKDVLRKPRPLEAGEFATKHDAWKRAEIERLFQDASKTEMFYAGNIVFSFAMFVQTFNHYKSDHDAISLAGAFMLFASGLAAASKLRDSDAAI